MLGLIPARLLREANRHALVDGIPFALPVRSMRMQALMAAFPVDHAGAQALLPHGVHAVRVFGKGVLAVTVVNYQETVIGKYIEYSIALACRHGYFGVGQYVLDLPVSTEISVKGGKGIWGMPKHQAPLNFEVGDQKVTSQYDLDGQLCSYAEVERPRLKMPMRVGASNYCSFRGMLMKSTVYFTGRAQLGFWRGARGRFEVGDHPRLEAVKALGPFEKPMFTAFFPEAHGVLDDHFESWFLVFDRPPEQRPEGLESVINLGLGEEWPPPPAAPH
jgi:Acetoacetate decarboxylase (ADC)